jgi:hypothetical protein
MAAGREQRAPTAAARALGGVAWLMVAACSAPAPPAVPAVPNAARIAVRIEFEPPLLAPGELHYAHECGECGSVATACTSVAWTLPPGPVALTLLADGTRHELALRIVPGMAPHVWRLRDPAHR